MSKSFVFAWIVILVFSAGVLGQDNEPNKTEVMRKVSQSWIEVGSEEYERGLFAASEKAFHEAQKQQAYLTDAQARQIKEYLEKIGKAAGEREMIDENIKAADELMAKGEILEAKERLEKVRASEFSNPMERRQAADKLILLNKQLGGKKKEIAELYKKSVALYDDGQWEKARDGFVRVLESGMFTGPKDKGPEDYMIKIDSYLLGNKSKISTAANKKSDNEKKKKENDSNLTDELLKAPNEANEPDIEQAKAEDNPMMIIVAEPIKEDKKEMVESQKSQPQDEESKKNNLQKSYMIAKIKDGVSKTRSFINEGKFYQAKESADTSQELLNENRERLGEEIFEQFNKEIEQLNQEIIIGRDRWLGSWEGKTAWKN